MNIKINIKEDAELRNYIKDMIRGQVKNIIRDELREIVQAELNSKNSIPKVNRAIGISIDNEIKKVIKEIVNVKEIKNQIKLEVSAIITKSLSTPNEKESKKT